MAATKVSPSAEVGTSICYAVQNTVNTLATFTETRCWPALKDGYGFAIVSDKPVFSVPAAKKAWLLTVAAALGKEMNDRNLRGGEVVVSDAPNIGNRVGWSFPVQLARNLQRRINRDEITLDAMYGELIANMKKVTAERR